MNAQAKFPGEDFSVLELSEKLDSIKSVSLNNERPSTALMRTKNIAIDGSGHCKEHFNYKDIDLLPLVFAYLQIRTSFIDSCIVSVKDSFIIYSMKREVCYIHGDKKYINSCLKRKDILAAINLYIIESPHSSAGHSNCLIFDTNNKEVERYEPHGNKILCTDFDEKSINEHLQTLISKEFKDYKYIAPLYYCPEIGFQSLESFNSELPRFDFETGYCQWWTIAYIEFRIMNKNIKREELQNEVIKFFGKTIDYKQYIRGRVVFFLKLFNYMIKTALKIDNKCLTVYMLYQDNEFMNFVINKLPFTPDFLSCRSIETFTLKKDDKLYGSVGSNLFITKSRDLSLDLNSLVSFTMNKDVLLNDCRDIEKYNKLKTIYTFESIPNNKFRYKIFSISNIEVYEKIGNWVVTLYSDLSCREKIKGIYFRDSKIDFVWFTESISTMKVSDKGFIFVK